ncbi:MAG: hypothetical protein ACRD2E_02670 [Terriglobales bacterium]
MRIGGAPCRIIPLALTLCVAVGAHPTPPATAKPLDNAAVARWLRHGFAPALVAAKVRQAPAVRFDTSMRALARLQAAGATTAVLLAILERETPRPRRYAPAPATRAPPAFGLPRRSRALATPVPPLGPPIVYIVDRSHSGLDAGCWQELARHSRLRLAYAPSEADWLLLITVRGRGLRRKESLQVFDQHTGMLLWGGQAHPTPFRRSAIRRLTDRFLRQLPMPKKMGGAAGTRATPPP